jgi:hypothetical protein
MARGTILFADKDLGPVRRLPPTSAGLHWKKGHRHPSERDLGEVEAEDHIMVGELNVPPGHLPDGDAYVERAENIPPEDRDEWIIKGRH